MIPDRDDYDSDSEWAIDAAERYIDRVAADHGLDDPDRIASSGVVETLAEANLELLYELRSLRGEDPPHPSATGRMGETPTQPRSADSATPFGTAPEGIVHRHGDAPTQSAANATPSAETADPNRESPDKGFAFLTTAEWLLYGLFAVLSALAPVVYYAWASHGLVDLPALQGTVVARLPLTPLFVASVLSAGAFVVTAAAFIVGRYGIVNPPERETVEQRWSSLRILAHLAAFSLLVTIATTAVFLIVAGTWPIIYGVGLV